MSGLAVALRGEHGRCGRGSSFTGFYLLPRWDVMVATGSRCDASISRSAAWHCETRSAHLSQRKTRELRTETRGARGPCRVRGRGALRTTALGAQVVWTRLLALLFGATTYTFAIILGVFLGGSGSVAPRCGGASRWDDSRELLAASQLALVAALAYAAEMIAKVIPYSSPARITPIRSCTCSTRSDVSR